ncbi:MAG: hypothetical protein IT410_04430 [Candidatus Doudnabacteria bacterium]|nr:hypothetical protein [Candidatus Doudnabacteria bacterium]
MNENQDKILSLAQASKQTGYHQDYLGYLCRTGKLEGQKVGRNWITTDKAVKTLMGEQVEDVVITEKIPVRVVSKPIIKSTNTRDLNDTSSVLAFASIEVKGLPIRLRAVNSPSSHSLVSHAEIAIVSKTISSLRLQVSSLMDQVRMLTATLVGQQVIANNVFPSQLYGHSQKFSSTIPLTSHLSSNEQVPSFSMLGAVDEKKIIKSFSTPRYDNSVVIILASILIALVGSAFLIKGNLFGTSTTLYSLYISNDENISSSEITDPATTQVVFLTDKDEQGQVLGVSTEVSRRLTPAENNEEYLDDLIMQNLVTAESFGFFSGSAKRAFTNIVNRQVPSLASSDITSLTAGTLAVNGNATVTGNLAVTGTIDPGFTDGSVVFQGASGLAQDNANFYWDETQESLGIGTADPSAKIAVAGSSGIGTGNITSSSGTSVTGTGTSFTTELEVGDQITVNGQARIVASISTDTALTTTVAFDPALTTTPNVEYVNTATTNTGSTEANTLSWNHTTDSTVENRLLIVAIAVHKNTALAIPTVASVTYGSQTMTQSDSTSGTNVGIRYYRLVAPEVGTKQITVTLSSSATARMVGQSILMANVNQATPFGNNASGGGTAETAGGYGYGPTTRYGAVSAVSLNGNITADYDEDGSLSGSGPSVELGNLSSGSTSDDVRLLVGFTHTNTLLFPGFYIGYSTWELSAQTGYVIISPSIVNAETATGAFTYRSNLLSVKDSGDYEQILFLADGSANFHNGITVDLTGGSNTYAALFNGGFVGIGTTTPTNELSLTGDADFSGTLGVDGGAVDPNIGINIESSAAYGGGGVYKYGVSVDLEATDTSHVIAGSFSASSTTSDGLPDHPILVGMSGAVYHTGTGRIDVGEGFAGVVQNAGGGWMNEAYGAFSQILNSGASSYINTSHGVYSDTVNTSSTTAITTASAFEGKIRTLSGGTAGYTTAIGLNLSNWSTPGATVGTSYGIYMDTSIDIGTTKYAIYSSSASGSYLAGNLQIGPTDLGSGTAGHIITVGRNTDLANAGAATGAGSINFQSKAGTAGYVWQDNAGNLRINSAAPSNANDTAGVVVGDQTSTRESKQDFADYTTYQDALQMVLAAPLHTFRYKKDVLGYGEDSVLAKTRIGYIADEVPGEFMWGNSIDQVSVNGILMASVKALNDEITSLKVHSNNATSTATIIPEHFYVSEDNIGQAQIVSGKKSVRVSFMSFYQYQPVVVATPTEFVEGSYRITDIDDSGFTIELESEQALDIFFNWHSFAGEQSKLSVSDGSSKLVELVIHQPDEIYVEPILDEPDQLTDGAEENTSESTEPGSNEGGEVAGERTNEPAPESIGEPQGQSEQGQPSE